MVTGHWYTNIPNFGSLSWFWRCKEHPCPLSPDLGLWRTLEVPDWGLASWYWFGYGHWSLVHPYAKFWLSILILKVQRSSMSFKSSFGALEDAGTSWLGFCIWILIWIWSVIFGTPMSNWFKLNSFIFFSLGHKRICFLIDLDSDILKQICWETACRILCFG